MMGKRKEIHGRGRPKAATAEILGRTPGRNVPSKWRPHYDRLVELRELLTRQQHELTNDALSEQPTYSTHMADAATDAYDRDLALGMLSSEQDSIYEIDQAIDRISNGGYGICEETGQPIEPARLLAIPWTRFCTEAERRLERDGAVKQTRLGPRQSVVRETLRKEPPESA